MSCASPRNHHSPEGGGGGCSLIVTIDDKQGWPIMKASQILQNSQCSKIKRIECTGFAMAVACTVVMF